MGVGNKLITIQSYTRNAYGIPYKNYIGYRPYSSGRRVKSGATNLKVGGSMHRAKTRLYSENTKILNR